MRARARTHTHTHTNTHVRTHTHTRPTACLYHHTLSVPQLSTQSDPSQVKHGYSKPKSVRQFIQACTIKLNDSRRVSTHSHWICPFVPQRVHNTVTSTKPCSPDVASPLCGTRTGGNGTDRRWAIGLRRPHVTPPPPNSPIPKKEREKM